MSTPIYEPLLKELRKQVTGGRVQAGSRLGTELGLARRHKLSRVSVRTAVSQLIEEGLLERRPGRGIYARPPPVRFQIVEAIMPSLDYMWRDIALGAQNVGTHHGTLVRICNACGDFEADLRMIRNLPQSGAHGAIIGSLHQPALREAVTRLHLAKFPMVLVDERLEGMAIPSVTFDNHQAGRMAAEELLQRGHRRIGFVGFTETAALSQRLHGLREALNDAGVTLDRSLIGSLPVLSLVTPALAEALPQCLEQILMRPDRPSALVFHDSLLAVHAYKIIRSFGLKIPDDISLVGIGYVAEFAWAEPSLACVVLPAATMGCAAMELLLQKLNHPDTPIEHRILPVTWQNGDSAGYKTR